MSTNIPMPESLFRMFVIGRGRMLRPRYPLDKPMMSAFDPNRHCFALHVQAIKPTRRIRLYIAIPPIALWMRYPLLDLADDVSHINRAKARSFFIFRVATLPSLIAIPLIIPFRMPREWIEVVIIPVVVTVIGMAWIQAGAWRIDNAKSGSDPTVGSIAWPLAAALSLLLIFQLLLRPGIRFY